MHFQLRTQGGTPERKALAVFVGTLVGCTPLLGLHLLICAVVAKVARLSPGRVYLAAHINNPLTAPFLFYAEWALGHRLLAGAWPALSLAEFRAAGWHGVGGSLLLGSLALGLALGTCTGLVAYVISRRSRHSPLRVRLVEATARRYVPVGSFTWEFVRGKLRHDPLYLRVLEAGMLPAGGRLVEIGCGRGILLALIQAAQEEHAAGRWSQDLPPPPGPLQMTGVEKRRRLATAARAALDDSVEILVAEPLGFQPPPCQGLALFDVLHSLPPPAQERLVAQAAAALAPGGVLLIREADAAAGLRFALTRAADHLRALLRREGKERFHYRSAGAWRELLEGAGLQVRSEPSRGTIPFANVLLTARRPA
jgi:uncharacterized protein (DUF2062 family)